MAPYYGDYPEDHAEIRIPFNTFDSNDPSASVTITNLADGDIEVHADGDTTQIATDGASVIINFAGETGSHMILIDSSADAAYTTGTEYAVKIVGTTIDGATVNAWVGTFSIERAGGALATALLTNTVVDGIAAQLAGITLLDEWLGALAGKQNADATALSEIRASGAGSGSYDPNTDSTEALRDLIGTAGIGLSNVKLPATGLDLILKGSIHSLAVADAIWDEILTGATHNITNSAGKRLRTVAAAFVVQEGIAQAGGAATLTLESGASTTNDIYQGDRIIIVGGTGIGEHGIVIGYVGSTLVATMSQNWVIQPDNTSEYEIAPADVDIETWQHTVVTASSTTSLPEVDVKGISDDATAANNLELMYDGTGYAGGTAKLEVDINKISGDATAADRLESLMDGLVVGQVADASALTTKFASDGFTEATDDHFNGRLITFLTGALTGQQTDITDYDAADGGQGAQEFTVTALTEAPANDVFFIVH